MMIRLEKNKSKVCAQVALETTIAMVVIIAFLLGVTQFFIWANAQIVRRHVSYQLSRSGLGVLPGTASRPEEFHVFPEEAR